ncbi:DUF481 domain-containing protein [Lewinella sp. W8]|uniref:DUF481 domain-containing protein n=1 Tax=Lewinella sp. W8 TaxID=2528208 RepID=UPI001067A379|nr:DUF481 domain-containing protein [Lewinella sp. W8]MTB52422.1 DUF481 domain-containing protein [Lewinella sp. W8]
MRTLLYAWLFFPALLAAQINESDTLDFRADLSLTGFYQGGNVETLIFRAQSGLAFKPWKNWVFKTQNSYVYQAFGRMKADEDILSLNFLYINPEKKFYPQLLGFVSTNFRRAIALRYLLGSGVTYRALGEKDHWLKVSLSAEFERTNFDRMDFNRSAYDGNATIETVRGTLWMHGRYALFDGKTIFTHVNYFQPSLRQSDNFRWRADFSLDFPLWKHVNFKINYLSTFESIVVAGQEQQDRQLTFGFTVKSY